MTHERKCMCVCFVWFGIIGFYVYQCVSLLLQK
jgi:hypothetical protein